MSRKIFFSYKYDDSDVHQLAWVNARKHLILLGSYQHITVRHFVDELQSLLASDDHINKGECDCEDLSFFKDFTIESRLSSKTHDNNITIMLISTNIKGYYKPELDQWIP